MPAEQPQLVHPGFETADFKNTKRALLDDLDR
jgi:hypothetical protein